jgi:hypothetical protein
MKIPKSPCATCKSEAYCSSRNCGKWDSWFHTVWRGLRANYMPTIKRRKESKR